jgi:fibronectin-binding autotransporter adhesin
MKQTLARLLSTATLLLALYSPAQAQNATWLLNPSTPNFNTPANWTPATVPTGTAIFDLSNTTTLTITQFTGVGTLQFTAAAPSYTFNLSASLTITGGGIQGATSANAPTFNSTFAGIDFHATSTAGTAIFNISGLAPMDFLDSSNAGHATINAGIAGNNDSFSGGFIHFFGNSTAANATITSFVGSNIEFHDASTAGNAILTAGNPTIPAGADNNGFIFFEDTSSADHAKITLNPGTELSFSPAFFTGGTSTAGNATITNNGGTTNFFQGSRGGNATITTNAGGVTNFFGESTGENAAFITNAGGIVDISGLGTFPDSEQPPVNVPGMTAGSIAGAGTYNLGSKELTVGSNNFSTTVSGLIEGDGGSLVKVGTGTLRLTGANTYSGGTNLNGGIIAINSDVNLGTGPLSFNGGTLEALAAGGGITSSKAVTLNAGAGTFLADAGTSSSLSGVISGVGSLTKDGLGTLTLTGANTYSGGTNLNGGILAVNSDGSLGTGPLSFNGGTLEALLSILSNKAITLNSGGGTFLADAGTASTLSGPITGVGAWTKTGPGTLILSGTNTYFGGTTVNAGTLQAGSTSGFSPNSAFIVNTGAVLDLNGFDSAVGSLSGSGLVTNTSASEAGPSPATLSVGADNTSTTFGGLLQDGASTLGLTKVGTGTLTLTGANTYSGGTNLNGGVLAVIVDSNLGTGPLSFNGGTLEALAAGVGIISSKAITLNIGGGTFLADAGTTSTLSGMISGIGAWTKTGPGTLILSGANTYSGGTTITAGTLQLGNGGTTGSIIGDVTDNGVFAVNRSDTYTFGGAISGSGSFEQRGIGTTILTGTNTYEGGTTIAAGTLQLGNGGVTGSITGDVTDNGVFAVNRSDTYTFGGAISGSGSFEQRGTGTTILTGTNTYKGGTTITAGTLQLGNGGVTGSITGDVTDNGVFAVNRSDTYTFDGIISGPGLFEQRGTGTTILTAKSMYTGLTTVNAGSLIVDGSIASAQTLVNAGGLLGGKGSLGGNLVNSGIVSPGNSPGTLTVANNYNQNASGTLRIEVAGLAPSQHDLLAIGGHASLNGTLQLIPLGGFKLQVGDKVTFLTAKGGVSGNFSAIQNEFATIVQTQITILPTAVVLEGTQGSFVPAACNPNTVAVAHALDSAVGNPQAAGLINFLDSQPFNQLCGDFELIAPEELASMYNIGFSVENVQTDNLNRRMSNIRAGSTGFSSAGFTMNGVTPTYSSGLAGPTGAEGKTGPSVLAPVPENRWGVFATGLGEFTHVAGTEGAPGFNLQTGGVTVGVDYRVCPNFAVGLLAGYAHTNADLVNNGNLEVNSAKFGAYATAFTGGFYLNSAVTGGWSDYDSHRTALGGTASGSTDGGDINVLVSGGYDWRTGNLSIGPTGSFQYNYLSFNGFAESGSLAPLKFNDQHADSIRTAFGMKATYDWKVGNVLVRPELRLAWQHEYGLSAYPIVASFADGAGSSFTVSGPKIGRDSLLIGAGAAVLWNDRIATYIYYDGEVARTNFDSHNISGGIRITF